MRKDADKIHNQLQKQRLKTMGEKFVLTSQAEILENQIKITKLSKQEFDYESNIKLRQLDKSCRESQRARQELELEIRGLESALLK